MEKERYNKCVAGTFVLISDKKGVDFVHVVYFDGLPAGVVVQFDGFLLVGIDKNEKKEPA